MGKFEKGNKMGKGRPKNSVNRSTKEIRDLFSNLLQCNLDYVQESLDIIRVNQPQKYIELLLKLSEYVLPKLQNTPSITIQEPQTFKVEFDLDEQI